MIVAAPLTLHILPLLSLALVWVVSSQLAMALLAPLQGRSYVAWSVGPLGFTSITSSKPSAVARFAGLVLPIALAALAGFEALTRTTNDPVGGLPNTLAAHIWLTVGGALVISLPRLTGALRETRFPLWGEARVLDRVARSATLGSIVRFTSAGRAYIRERFDASPEEFLRIVRRRSKSTPLATGTPS